MSISPADAGDRLTSEQLGHLRHLNNLSLLPDHDWSSMQQRDFGQDDGATYRYQLAFAAYTLALAHIHRLPAAPGLFQPIIQRLISKILLPDTWLYWRDVSRAGGVLNPHLSLEEKWDPVAKDNVMYSAYVYSMVALHDWLFDDDRYAQADSIVFEFESPFWGGSAHRFAYGRTSLRETLYWQLVENGYIGIACQPNCIFQICLQPAILGFRLQDRIDGGAVADEVTSGFQRAWEDLGQFGENGLFSAFVRQDSGDVVGGDIFSDPWLGSLMNMWNSEVVETHYAHRARDYIHDAGDGTLTVGPVPEHLENVALTAHGWYTMWASEMGDVATRDGLLAYADRHLNPSWADGGLFYPRQDESRDAENRRIVMDPFAGNVHYAYARLNVPGGLRGLYDWPGRMRRRDHPALTGVAHDVDVSQAVFDESTRTLTFAVRRRTDLAAVRDDAVPPGTVEIELPAGVSNAWILRCEGEPRMALTTPDSRVVVKCPDRETVYTFSQR